MVTAGITRNVCAILMTDNAQALLRIQNNRREYRVCLLSISSHFPYLKAVITNKRNRFLIRHNGPKVGVQVLSS